MNVEPEQLSRALGSTDLCCNFDKHELVEFLPHLRIQEVPEHETIVEEGSPGDAWYVILEGEVSVSKGLVHGPPHVLAHLGKGECFGEMALVDGSPRMATVKTVADSTLARLDRATFERLKAQTSPFAIKLLTAMASVLSRRQRELTYILTDLLEVDDPDMVPDQDTIDEMLRTQGF